MVNGVTVKHNRRHLFCQCLDTFRVHAIPSIFIRYVDKYPDSSIQQPMHKLAFMSSKNKLIIKELSSNVPRAAHILSFRGTKAITKKALFSIFLLIS